MKLSRIAFLKPTVDTEMAVRPIQVATLPETFEPGVPRSPAVAPTQPFGDSRQSGRLDASLGDPRAVVWSPRFAAPLLPDTRAHSVFAHGDAIVVQAGVWQLFGTDGRLRGAGPAGTGPVAVSPTDRTLRWVDLHGRLTAATLDTGEPIWTHGLFHGDGATYPFLAVRGEHAVVIGADRFVNPEGLFRPEPTLAVEAITVNQPLSIAAGGILESVTSPGALTAPRDGGDVFGAAGDDNIVVAWRDHVMTLDFDLTPHSVRSGTFEPRAVSVGDAGRTYLIVRTADGPRLWMLNAEGEQVFSAVLPDEANETLVPPIVSPDHRVFVVTSKRIVAFSPIGDRLWEFAPAQGRPYASVTADGWLLVVVDQVLGVLDAEGRGTSLFAAPGEVFRTAPVLTPEGEILLASERSLLCLRYDQAIEMGEPTLIR